MEQKVKLEIYWAYKHTIFSLVRSFSGSPLLNYLGGPFYLQEVGKVMRVKEVKTHANSQIGKGTTGIQTED